MKHYDRKHMLHTWLKLANDYERGRVDRPFATTSLFLALQRFTYLSDTKWFLKAFLVDNFLNTFRVVQHPSNFSGNWAAVCSLLSAEVLFSPFITSEAIHSVPKQVRHAKAERECGIRLPQPCWFILKSFSVHKSSAADIVHLPFSCSTLQPCAEKRECLGQNPTTSALIFFAGFQPSLVSGGSSAVGRCVLL